jgi:hypothetical protein
VDAYYSLWPFNAFIKVSMPLGNKPKLSFVLDGVARLYAAVIGY